MYAIDKALSDRIHLLKALSIVLVVFIHAYSEGVNFQDGRLLLAVPEWLAAVKRVVSGIIAASAVPIFFFVSSVLLYAKAFSWKENLAKKSRSILLPYFLWNTVWILVYLILQAIPASAPYFSNPDNIVREFGAAEWLDAYLGLFGRNPYPLLYPFWFLRDLFFLNVLSVPIQKVADRFPVPVLCAILLLWFSGGTLLPDHISAQAIVFFTLGYYVVKYDLKIGLIDRLNGSFLLPAYFAFLALDFFFGKPILFFHKACVLLGAVCLIRLSKSLCGNRPAAALARGLSPYVFVIYACHEMNLTIAKKFLTRMLPQTLATQTLLFFGLPVLMISGCVAFGYLLKRFANPVYKVLTGIR